jgi:tetratricopeptide (TPR) repeat protein
MNIWLMLLFIFVGTGSVQDDFALAESLYKQGRLSESKPIFERLLVKNPKHLQALEYRGDIAGQERDWDLCVKHYGQLVKLAPKVADYHYKYGGALGMKAKNSNKFKALSLISDVRESFEHAIALNPKHIDARWALLELNLQLPAMVGGSYKKAALYAEELFSLSAVDGYLARARLAEYGEKWDVAEKNYKIAFERHQSKTAARKLADLYKNQLRKPESARHYLEASKP